MSDGDRIALRGLRAFGRHGANPGERDVPQPFDVDVVLAFDLTAARRSDALRDTFDYAALHRAIVAIVGRERYALLERLGDEILNWIFSDGRVARAEVTIAKPGLLGGATPSVTVVRER